MARHWFLGLFTSVSALRFVPPLPMSSHWQRRYGTLPSTLNCTEEWIEQPLDHFSFSLTGQANATFMQRYYTYDAWWTPESNGPIFFYTGNEAEVDLYVNSTGLMWENGEAFGALLVFAEHRFYGASQPKLKQGGGSYPYLSHELALADYAVLIQHLRRNRVGTAAPVIAFGGSYGGKLAAWLRMKYPSTVAGSISASAPLLAFQTEDPVWDTGSYYRVVTKTAEHYSRSCAANVRAAFPLLDSEGETEEGRTRLRDNFRLCEVPSAAAVRMLKFFIRDGFDSLAMGNYPFPSAYIAGTTSTPMPAWPAKVACSHLDDGSLAKSGASALFPAIRSALSVFYNVSQTEKCFKLPSYPTPTTPGAPMDGIWDWQWCTEQLPDSFWFSTDGVTDSKCAAIILPAACIALDTLTATLNVLVGAVFWANPYNQTLVDEHCAAAWDGATPRSGWIVDEYGGRSLGRGHSNIVFTSGGFDGWSSGGVATNLSNSLIAILIPEGGHHLDLMFSNPQDPPSVVAAREFELESIRTWIAEFKRNIGRVAWSWGDKGSRTSSTHNAGDEKIDT